MFVSSPNSDVEALIPSMVVFGDGVREVTRVRGGREGGRSEWDQCPCKKSHSESLLRPPVDRRGHVSSWRDVGCPHANRRGLVTEPTPLPPPRFSQPPELWEMKLWLCKLPRLWYFVWQFELSKTEVQNLPQVLPARPRTRTLGGHGEYGQPQSARFSLQCGQLIHLKCSWVCLLHFHFSFGFFIFPFLLI